MVTAGWVRLIVATVGPSGGFTVRQPFDFTQACGQCGAGALPADALWMRTCFMGKKLLDRTPHDGYVIVRAALADALLDAGLTGFTVRPVQLASGRGLCDDLRWLCIIRTWPAMLPGSSLVTDDLCPECGRTGFFDDPEVPSLWRYRAVPADAADFNATWERFGYWRNRLWEPGIRGVGGQAGLVVSARAQGVLLRKRVRSLRWGAIELASGT